MGKTERDPLGRTRRRWEDNINMDIQKVGCAGMDWVELAQDRDSWRALVSTVRTLGFHKIRRISCLAENRLASREVLCSME